MTDRVIVYPASSPQDIDILGGQLNAMIAIGYLAQATMGSGVVIDGLLCTQTSPASMSVTVAPGSIFQLSTIDSTSYGSLGANANPLLKIGINTAPTVFALAAPVTSGQSVNYLIEASFLEQDGSPVTLPYYNAANPAQPFSGPSNSGTPQNTRRKQTVSLQLKAGTAAVTGTQSTPSVDAGWVGAWVITVANGQTSVINANIAQFATAPFLPFKLPQLANNAFLSNIRTKLTTTLNVFVATNGNDSLNTGLTSGSPFLTLQKAYNFIANTYDLQGFNAIIHVADGSYAAGVLAQGQLVGQAAAVQIVGNVGSPTNVVVTATNTNCFTAVQGAFLSVTGVRMAVAGTTSAACISAQAGGTVSFSAVDFGTLNSVSSHMTALIGGTVEIVGNYTISGGGGISHYAASAGSVLFVVLSGVTISNNPSFSGGFANANHAGGVLTIAIAAFSGTTSGPKFSAVGNGYIDTSGAGVNFFPGTVAGSLASGGQYI